MTARIRRMPSGSARWGVTWGGVLVGLVRQRRTAERFARMMNHDAAALGIIPVAVGAAERSGVLDSAGLERACRWDATHAGAAS